MTRNRASAKKAGADLEIGQEEYWRRILRQPHIYRGKSQGKTDKGDLLGVELPDSDSVGYLTIECKNVIKAELGTWWKEAERERKNNTLKLWTTVHQTPGGAKVRKPGEEIPSPAAIVIHKRKGFDVRKQPEKQWVTLTVEELIALIRGNRNHIEE